MSFLLFNYSVFLPCKLNEKAISKSHIFPGTTVWDGAKRCELCVYKFSEAELRNEKEDDLFTQIQRQNADAADAEIGSVIADRQSRYIIAVSDYSTLVIGLGLVKLYLLGFLLRVPYTLRLVPGYIRRPSFLSVNRNRSIRSPPSRPPASQCRIGTLRFRTHGAALLADRPTFMELACL